MFGKIKTYQWIIPLATLSLLLLGGMQMNWILRVNDLQEKETNRELKNITPSITLRLAADAALPFQEFVNGKAELPMEIVHHLVDSMMQEAGFYQTYHYAIFQEKKYGIYKSNSDEFEAELKSSEFKQCLSCVTSIQMVGDFKDMDGRKDSTITFLKEVQGERNPKSKLEREDYLWLSLYLPQTSFFSKKELWGFLALTILLMGILIALFSYTIRSLAKQKKIGQVKDDFFNNMTHEFKTPLSSIRLAAKVLQQDFDENKKETYLKLIENESKKLEGQVDKILQLSSIESHQMILEKENVDLHQVIKEVIERLKLIIEQKNANVNVLLQLEQPTLQGDASHLSNCIYNLVENALKYSGTEPQITISTFEKNGKKIISVKDKGEGIAKEHQAEIFDRFYRAQKNDQYKGQGFGIGLSYVKTIVEAHGGQVFLNEKYQEGCEFRMAF